VDVVSVLLAKYGDAYMIGWGIAALLALCVAALAIGRKRP
jgi:hypothetical protein